MARRAAQQLPQKRQRGDVHLHDIRLKMRDIQRKTRCSTKTLMTTLEVLLPLFDVEDLPASISGKFFAGSDKKMMRSSNTICLQLHGCVGCHKHVFEPSEKSKRCPRCGFPRRKANGEPNEVTIIYSYDKIDYVQQQFAQCMYFFLPVL